MDLAKFTTRSIKKSAKLWGLRTAVSMLDLTTLEGADSPGKVKQMCYKAAHLHDAMPDIPHVAAVCVYPTLVRIARETLAQIKPRGNLPIVVGGTGFYLRALLDGLFEGPERSDELRERLNDIVHSTWSEVDVVGLCVPANEKIGPGDKFIAAELAKTKPDTEAPRLAALRDRLEDGILSSIAGTERNGAASPRVANTANVSIDRVEAESMLIGLDLAGIAVSSGSACSSGTLEPSHVLKAMGLPHPRTLGSIRFSLGTSNTEQDIDRVLDVLPPLVEKLRSLTTVGSRK